MKSYATTGFSAPKDPRSEFSLCWAAHTTAVTTETMVPLGAVLQLPGDIPGVVNDSLQRSQVHLV